MVLVSDGDGDSSRGGDGDGHGHQCAHLASAIAALVLLSFPMLPLVPDIPDATAAPASASSSALFLRGLLLAFGPGLMLGRSPACFIPFQIRDIVGEEVVVVLEPYVCVRVCVYAGSQDIQA